VIDTRELSRSLNNVVQYGQGFVEGINAERITFNTKLATAMVAMLYGYIDSKSVLKPESLQHMYEPGMVGREAGRLFEFNTQVTAEAIMIHARFLESSVEPLSGGDVFRNRAEVMESGASIVIEPKDGGILAFMDNGELVVTSSSITVEHPGGLSAEKGFADTVFEFFNSYLTKEVLASAFKAMATPVEFDQMFAQGVRGGRSVGRSAAKKLMNRSLNESI